MEQDYKYLCLFENAPVAMWEIDLSAIRDCLVRDPGALSGDVARVEEIFGYARSRAVNRRYLDLFGALADRQSHVQRHLSDLLRACHGRLLSPLLRGEERVVIAALLRFGDGSLRSTSISAIVLVDDWSRIVLAIQDEQSAQNALFSLQESEGRYKALFDCVAEAVIIVDVNLRITFANPRVREIFGYREVELLGERPGLLVRESEDRDIETFLEQCRVTGAGKLSGRQNREIRGRHKNGDELTMELRLAEITMEGDQGFVLILSDISELARYRDYLENEVAERTAELRGALAREEQLRGDLEVTVLKERELTALQENFVSVVSHEFRTPLAVIRSAADLLGLYGDRLSPEQSEAQLERIKCEVEHMTEMLQNMVLFERSMTLPEDAEKRNVNLGEFIRETASACRIANRSEREVLVNCSELPVLYTSEMLLRRIVANLLANAMKYAKGPGPIRVNATSVEDDVRILFSNPGKIQPETSHHIFEPFVRGSSDHSSPGSGLGLVISSRAADLLGGTVVLKDYGPPEVVFELKLSPKASSRNVSSDDVTIQDSTNPGVRVSVDEWNYQDSL